MNRRQKRKQEKREIELLNRAEAALSYTPDRHFSLFHNTDPRREISNLDLQTIYKRARALYNDTPEIRQAVMTLTLLMGTITPRPSTRDEEYNKAARAAFLRRVSNPRLFEQSGRLNFFQAQKWIEQRAIIDGDSLTVLTRHAYDKGGGIALYAAPQIIGDDDKMNKSRRAGVSLGRGGRVDKYFIRDYDSNKSYAVDANKAILYGHNPDPADPRHPSELLGAICTAQDIYEINRLHKQQVKIGATFGLVETKNINDKRSGLNDLVKARMNKGEGVNTPSEQPLIIDGVKAISLEAGRDLKTLHNTNPSNEVRAYVRDLINSLAYSVGIDPQILYNPETLGSASTRFILAKAKDWARTRLYDRELWANRIYQHVIACEIEAGRLAPCQYPEEQYNVTWINRTEWSIDLGHDASRFISLVQAGLADANTWTLSHYDMTVEEIAERTAHDKAHIKQIAETYGLPYDALLPNAVGGSPIQWDDDKPPMPSDTEPEDKY